MTRTSLRLRRLQESDLDAMRDGFNSGAIAALTRYIFTLSAAAERYRMRSTPDTYRFTILRDERPIGISTLRPPMYSGMELTIGIFATEHLGRGIGTYAVAQTCAFGFNRIGLHRIELGVYPDNLRARRCYEKCGFKEEALLRSFLYNGGEYRDVVWMSLLKREWTADQRRMRV